MPRTMQRGRAARRQDKSSQNYRCVSIENGAGDGIRTHDIHLGKLKKAKKKQENRYVIDPCREAFLGELGKQIAGEGWFLVAAIVVGAEPSPGAIDRVRLELAEAILARRALKNQDAAT
jgi:hypothetical protein